MATFKDCNELHDYLEKKTKEILIDKISKEVRATLIDNVEKMLYDAQNENEEYYERTYELINSIEVSNLIKVGNYYEIEIFFNTDKINPNVGRYGMLNQHMDLYGNDVSNMIPIWMEEGHGGIVEQKPLHFTKATYEDIKNNYINIFNKYLEKIGIKIVR